MNRDRVKRAIMARLGCDLRTAIDAVHDVEMGADPAQEVAPGLLAEDVTKMLGAGEVPALDFRHVVAEYGRIVRRNESRQRIAEVVT